MRIDGSTRAGASAGSGRLIEPSAPCHDARRGGFTLVELLVAIGIIVVLIAILLPALSGARAAAGSIKCKAMLRQFALAMDLYTNEFDGYQVDAYKIFDYETGLVRYLGGEGLRPTVARCPADGLSEGDPRLGPLGLNLSIASTGENYLIRDQHGNAIQLHASIGANENALSATHRATQNGEGIFWIKRNKIRVSGIDFTKVMVFADWQNNLRSSYDAPPPDPTTLKGPIIQTTDVPGVIGSLAFRHRGACNVAFLDGHVSELRTDLPLNSAGTDFRNASVSWGSAGSGQHYKLYYPFGPGRTPTGYAVYGDFPHIAIR